MGILKDIFDKLLGKDKDFDKPSCPQKQPLPSKLIKKGAK